MQHMIPLSLAAALLTLSACVPAQHSPAVARLIEPEPIRIAAQGPPDAAPGSCWGRENLPAIVETETRQTILPGNDNTGSSPVYRTETRQKILRDRRELWFETLCESALTPDFVASLQRALAARDLYRGPITREMDARTRNAVRRYQKEQGLDSAILSVAAARQMGLVIVDVPRPVDAAQ